MHIQNNNPRGLLQNRGQKVRESPFAPAFVCTSCYSVEIVRHLDAAKLTLTPRSAPNVDDPAVFCGYATVISERCVFSRPFSRFNIRTELFEVVRQCKEEKLSPDIGFPSGQKTAKTKVIFEQSKRPLDLDRTAHPQVNTMLCCNVLLRCRPHFPEGLLQHNFLRLSNIPCLTAGRPVRAVRAVLASIPTGRYWPSLHQFRILNEYKPSVLPFHG